LFQYDGDILVQSIGLWLDARRVKPFSFVSHAHGDHVCRHERVLATPATIALGKARRAFSRKPGTRTRRKPQSDELPLAFYEPTAIGDAKITLYPAGHILGSAQILVERRGRRLLYSGDFCPETTVAAETIEIPRADTLIMECTYGLPEHRFPARPAVVDNLCGFAADAVRHGRTPVFFCYALGKGQEVMRLLGAAGIPVAAERETRAMAEVYERFGVDFPNCRLLDSPAAKGEAVVTPSLMRAGAFLKGRRIVTAAVTGWAAGDFGYRAQRADARIPLSDHADFEGLLAYVRAVSPEKTYAVHGPEEFAYYLRKAGFRVGHVHEKAPLFSQA